MLRFEVLGPLEVYSDKNTLTPSAAKLRQVLALLLLRSDSVVGIDSVIAELWGEEPPSSATTTTQTYIYQLRKLLNEGCGEILATKAPGYVLHLDQDQLDAHAFQRLLDQGTQLLEHGHAREASDRLRDALNLWNGPQPLANTVCGRLLGGHAVRLDEMRIRALETRIEADIHIGRGRMLVGELRSLIASHPLNEWFHARLIEVLHRTGRRGEALQAYQGLRRTLQEELGLEPTPSVQRLQIEILRASTA